MGDELIVSGQARVAQLSDPRKVRVLYEKGQMRWSEIIWANNPRIARIEEQGDFQILVARENYLRPYMVEKTPERWTWKEYRPPPGEFYFSERELTSGQRFAGRVVLEPTIKAGASPNKRWPWVKWNKLAFILMNAGVKVTQLGPQGVPDLDGPVERVITPGFRYAASILAEAKLVVCHEGGIHHAAAALGTPAIVLYGGFISPAVTGYESQTNIFTGEGLGCGMRVKCSCCETAMNAITAESIADKVLAILNKKPQSEAA